MMNIQIKEQFLKEYDKLIRIVNESRKDNFPVNLVKWFDYLEDSDIVPVKFVIARFMGNPNYDAMYRRFTGYITLNDSDPFIKQIKEACRVLDQVQRRSEIWNDFELFRATLMEIKGGVFNVDNFSRADYYLSKFKNFSDGLREVFEKSLSITDSDPTVDRDEQREIPASDRIVTINHNAEEYHIVIKKLGELEVNIKQSNSIDNEEKDRLLAELNAGESILKRTSVRLWAIAGGLGSVLWYIVISFRDAAAGQIADDILTLLRQFIGF